MKKDIYIIGAGSVGCHVALNIAEYSGNYRVAGFFDDDTDKIGKEIYGFKVLGPVSDILKREKINLALGIAFPKIKKNIVVKLSENRALIYPTLIHEKAWVSNGATIGKGSIIYPGTSINYGSTVRDFVVANMNCAFGHHTEIGSFSSFAPNVSTGGHTKIMEGVDFGIGSSTIQNISVGEFSVIGGKSMLINDVLPKTKVAGVPARYI